MFRLLGITAREETSCERVRSSEVLSRHATAYLLAANVNAQGKEDQLVLTKQSIYALSSLRTGIQSTSMLCEKSDCTKYAPGGTSDEISD